MKFALELDQKRPIVPCMFTFGSTKIPNAMALHEILHGTTRINAVKKTLASNYIGERQKVLTNDQQVAIWRISEVAVIRKYVEGMAKLNPSLVLARSRSGIDESIFGGERAAFMELIRNYNYMGALKIQDQIELANFLADTAPEADEMCDPPPWYKRFWDRGIAFETVRPCS
ncbi:MAG: hypothetical protein INF48_11930 [Rhodobacter sp.]|nr:hypothetical protein [Rhodobacter sp.]